MTEIQRIQEASQYLATLLRCRADYSEWLWDRKNLYRRYPLTGLYHDLRNTIREAPSFAQLLQSFREHKQRHFLRIGGRDLLGLAPLAETVSQLSDLASVSLQVGLEVLSSHPEWWADAADVDSWHRLRRDVRLVVMGLGKLGGQELNYVSDVDLLFLCSSGSESDEFAAEAPVLLSRLCQWLARLLADQVGGDRVFQVDLRLRPMGKDGKLVPSLSAAAEYYLHQGRPWERQMLLKARPVAGDRPLGNEFLQEVRPFVFRRFLDFQALDELKAMRDRILAEAVRPRQGWQQFDVKLGIGGIREIEFLAQSFQLIYGGRHPELDEPNTLRCFEKLKDLGLLGCEMVEELKGCYTFLRRVEHWVQLDQNRQTQKLPQSEDALRRLSAALGFEGDSRAFMEKLERCCTAVHGHFTSLFHASDEDEEDEARDAKPEEETGPDGNPTGNLPAGPLARLKQHLNAFPPHVERSVLHVLKDYSHMKDEELSEKIVVRLERYFSQVVKRPGLIKVFHASVSWFEDVCRGIVKSELVADLLSHHPSLVEGVATTGGGFPSAAEWESASARLLARANDYEEGLEWLRRLKNERLFQLVLADLRGDLAHDALELQLSMLAEFVVRHTYERVLANLHLETDLPLAVLGMGKLGSLEMSYLSDLDLVFVYEPKPGESADQIPPDVVRLIQRFMRMLSTPLHEGPGYAVDARLRPTGSYGPLIITRDAWVRYYMEQADIWEVQALIRMRSVAGNEELGLWIEKKAGEICYRRREPGEVWDRLCHLRQRMQRERSEERTDLIDIKLGMGGLADLEFLVQGLLLIEGYSDPSFRNRSVRGALPIVLANTPGLEESARAMQTAFDAMRSLDHRLRLHTNLSASRLSPGQFEKMQFLGLWPPASHASIVEDWQDLQRYRRHVRSVLLQYCPGL
ncbi:MAG: bifunctional [glutamate--ammonia ligase]-adenylyl-L-tyrosine phosphorylase/[glutamate--ammonia-ligase] adenylyltransferase [Syntrophobacteraceae bacterium]|nr:bifunctional [glutamate--ammonia ligase]-adenylyl-L-tyrosine phosphorylase/[glutamate--ammonia-ligase] adenylyltransferase [Desulfobacteraceae bacterium]